MTIPAFIADVSNEINYLIAGLTVLSGVVGVFWKIIHTNHKETKDRGDKLETKLDENNDKLISLTDEMGQMKGKIELAEKITPRLNGIAESIDNLSASVLAAVAKDNND